jgi:hypothetical protein
VHPSGNTDFWRNDMFSPRLPSSSGNKTFGADRQSVLADSLFDMMT